MASYKWKLSTKYIKMYEAQEGRCFYCLVKRELRYLTRDHYLPRTFGHTFNNNVVLACTDCNGDKGSKDIYNFRMQLCRKLVKYLNRPKVKKSEVLQKGQIDRIERYKQAIKTCTKILKEGVSLVGNVCYLPQSKSA